jgi:glycosyltransferase 2 family protein
MSSAPLLTSSKRRSLTIGGLIFILLTVAVFSYQFYRIQSGDALPELNQLRWTYLILILCFLPLETLVLGFRMWIMCRVLQPGISFWTCFEADLASSGIALLTPSQIGGGPGQIYMLNRGGARLGTALNASLIAFTGTMLSLLGCGFYALFIADVGHTGAMFVGAVLILAIISAAMVFFGLCPGFFRSVIAVVSRLIWRIRGGNYPLIDWWPPDHSRTGSPANRMDWFSCQLADLVYTFRADLRQYLQRGKISFLIVCLLSLTFLASRCLLAYFCVRFLGIEVSTIGIILGNQIALLFLTYLAPTPGNAGVAEGASAWIMENIVPLGFAPFYNLLWRFSTVYIAAIAGIVLLIHRITLDHFRPSQSPAGEREV